MSRLCLLPLVALLCLLAGTAARAEKFDDEPGVPDFLDLSVTPQYQSLHRDGGHNGNYEVDFIGLWTLRQGDERWGDTRVVWWWLYNHTFSGTSTGELSSRAGLLWGINDGDAPDPEDALGVLALQQVMFDGQLELLAGKLYPGNDFAESDYWGDDRDTFLSEMMASDVAGRWFATIGLGLRATWNADNWFIQGMMVDAQAEKAYLDFDSLGKGRFLWGVELGYRPKRPSGLTSLSLMPYRIDATESLTSETGWVAAFTHEFGEQADYALFGRYTWRNGGEGRTPEAVEDELPVRRGGFVGVAWNAPLQRPGDRLAAAFMHGTPTDWKRAQGYDDQYGLEVYWKVKAMPWLLVTPDVQLVRNRDDEIETILGMMFKLQWSWSPGA